MFFLAGKLEGQENEDSKIGGGGLILDCLSNDYLCAVESKSWMQLSMAHNLSFSNGTILLWT